MNPLRSAASNPVAASVTFAILLGLGIVWVTGGNPFEAYTEIFTGATQGSGLRNTIGRSIPIIGMALAVSIAFRSGIINLGGEGQMIVGGLAGTIAALYLPGPGIIVIPLSIVAGGLGGVAWALLAAFGQTKLKVPILISTLLLNYTARGFTSYLVSYPFSDEGTTLSSTAAVRDEVRMPKVPIFGGVSLTIIAIILLGAAIAVVYRRTVAGFETEVAGQNQRFARYGGVDVERNTIWVMAVSGAIGGMVGTHLVLAESFRYIDGEIQVTGYAWTGLLVALLAANRPLMILIAGLFFSGMQIGGLAMQRNTDVSWRLAQVLQAVLIIAVASKFRLLKPTTAPPRRDSPPSGAIGVAMARADDSEGAA